MNKLIIFHLCFFAMIGMISLQSCREKEELKKVTVYWEQELQRIDGFGVGEADWADEVYLFKQRDSVMDCLFGRQGLRLNILRGEIFPHYQDDKTVLDFEVSANLEVDSVKNNPDHSPNELLRRGQLWVTQEAKNKYQVNKLIFSVWSPPKWMKDNNGVSGGKLLNENYQNFADYLAAFYEAYASVGLVPYAISPSNEPGYAAPWNSCVWSASEMGDFIMNYLGPTFEKKKIDASILFGENPAWSVEFDKLNMISSADFVSLVLTQYPGTTQFPLIAAGHGYVIPDTISSLPAEYLKTPIVPFKRAEEAHVPVWLTEISDITPLDISMKDALYWGETFHKYLSEANINALVWWCGARPTTNNESLIVLDSDQNRFILPKRYDVFGNFSRYISEGSIRLNIDNQISELLISAYKHEGEYTIVIVNPLSTAREFQLDIAAMKPDPDLIGYLTNNTHKWEQQTYHADRKSHFVISVPAEAVLTLTGKTMK